MEQHADAAAAETAPGQATPGLLRVAWQRKPLVALGLVTGLVVGALYYAQCTPVYQSTAQVLVIKKRPEALPLSGSDPRLSSYEDYLSTHVTLMKSPLIVERAVHKEGLQGLTSMAEERNPTASVIKAMSVSRDRDTSSLTNTNILNLSFRCSRSDECSRVLNAVINSYKDFLDETYRNTSDETVKLITQARDVLQKELGEKESAYQEFRKQAPLMWKTKEGMTLSQGRLNDIEAKRSALQVRRAEIRGRLKAVDAAVRGGGSPAALTAMINEWTNRLGTDRLGTEVVRRAPSKELEEQLLPLLLEEESLKADFGPDHPQLKAVRKKIELARAAIARQSGLRAKVGDPLAVDDDARARETVEQYTASLRQELDDVTMSEAALAELFERETAAARKLNDYEVEDANLTNEIARIKQLYDGIIKRLQEVGFAKDFGGYDARIIAPAEAGKKVEPRALLVFSLAAVLGVLGGLGLAYLAEVTDKSFRTPEEIRRRLGLPVVGHIPLFVPEADAAEPAALLDPVLCTYFQSKSVEAEAYRGVRTALYFSTHGEGHRIIQVTSPTPGDGKSTLAANLAVSIAQSGKRVLLVDGDFRKPRQHKLFGLPKRGGLSLVLAGEAEAADAIQATGVAGLSVLPCGPLPPNPAELLTSPRFKEFLDAIRVRYDFILVDTPPLLAVTDPSVVAPRVDGVLLTIRVSKNGRPQAERAKEILGTLGANVLGVVVNGLEHRDRAFRYGYESYAYGGPYGAAEAETPPADNEDRGAWRDEDDADAGANGFAHEPVLSAPPANGTGAKSRNGRGVFRRFFSVW